MAPFLDSRWFTSTNVAALYAAAGGAPATTPAQDLVDTWASGGAGSDGFAMVFEDAAGTDAPSIYVKDSGTPANDTDINLTDDFDAFNSFLTYTSPSPKIVRQSDGNLKYCAHNLSLYSEQFDNAAWTKNNLTVTANQTADYTGIETTADLLTAAASGTNPQNVYPTTDYSSTANQSYSASIDFKAGTNDFCVVTLNNTGFNRWAAAVFDISSGSTETAATETATGASGGAIISTSQTSLGNGWFRVTLNAAETTIGAALRLQFGFAQSSTGNTFNTSGNITHSTGWASETLYATRAQVYSFPADTTYLPTTTAARYALPIQHDSSNNAEGLLVEPAATNLTPNSDGASGWSTANATNNAASVVLPSGLTGGRQITENTVNDRHIFYDIISGVTAGTYVASFIVKDNTRRYVHLQFANGADRHGAVFDLTTGSVTDTNTGGAATGTSQGSIALGNGWYRCWVSFTTALNSTGYPNLALSDSATPSYDANLQPTYTGDGSSSIYFAGAQVETGSVPTSPIITTGATVTRAADDLTKATSAYPQAQQDESSSLFVDFTAKPSTDANHGFAGINDDSTADRTEFFIAATLGTLSARFISSTGNDVSSATTGSIVSGSNHKLIFTLATNDVDAYLDGSSILTGSSFDHPGSLTTMDIGQRQGLYANCIIRQILYLPEKMSNTDAASITT